MPRRERWGFWKSSNDWGSEGNIPLKRLGGITGPETLCVYYCNNHIVQVNASEKMKKECSSGEKEKKKTRVKSSLYLPIFLTSTPANNKILPLTNLQPTIIWQDEKGDDKG